MKRLILVLTFIFAIPVTYAVIFNEVMYDPIDSDDSKEWFEIYNNENRSIDVQGWRFFEGGTNHNIVLVQGNYILMPYSFAVIAEDAATFLSENPGYSGNLFDSTFSLSNTGETLVLRNKTLNVKDNLTYSYIWGGSENGYSIGFHNGQWKETIPSPGQINQVSNNCDWKVIILLNKLVFEDKTDVSWQVRTERLLGEPRTVVTLKRSVEDIYGKSVRTYSDLNHNITTRETLSYEPNLNPGTYLLKAEINPGCNDTNNENNLAQELVAVKGTISGTSENKETSSSLQILQVYDLGKDKEAEFGQLIRVKLDAYKGNTAKQVISLWIERGKQKASKVLEFKMPDKYSEQEITLPMQILPNCDNKLEEGQYEIITEGLGESDKKSLDIFGFADKVCPKTSAIKAETKTEAKTDEKEQIDDSESLFQPTIKSFNSAKPFALSTVMFESSQKKAEKLVPYLLASLTCITVVFAVLFGRGLL